MLRLFGVNIVQKITSFGALFLYPIVFTPDAVGVYAVFASYLTISVVFFFGPIEAVIGRFSLNNKPEQLQFLISLQFAISLFIIFVITPIIYGLTLSNDIFLKIFIGLPVAVALTGVGKNLVRLLRFTSRREAEKFLWFKVLSFVVIIGCGVIAQDPNAIIYATVGAFFFPILYAYFITADRISWSVLPVAEKLHRSIILKELLWLFPNRIFGMTALPVSTLMISDNLGLEQSGKYFVVVSILNAIITVSTVFPEEIQRKIYRGEEFTLSMLTDKEWLLFPILLLLCAGSVSIDLSGLFLLFGLNEYWQEIAAATFSGVLFVYFSLLKVCHIGLYFSDKRYSAHLLASTFIFWTLVISGLYFSESISDAVLVFCSARGAANVFALVYLRFLSPLVGKRYPVLLGFNCCGLLLLVVGN